MENKNVERFINGTVRYLSNIGFEFERKHRWMKFLLIAGLSNMILVLVGEIIFILSDVDLIEKSPGISYMNYYLVSSGKVIALLKNRKAIVEMFYEFRQIYPSVQLEKAYNLQPYLRTYLWLERILSGFFKSITLFFLSFPSVVSLLEMLRTGEFIHRTPLMMYTPLDINKSWIFYVFTYFQQAHSSFTVGSVILGLDLCLFCCLLQLCMHFDIIKKNILQIEPDETDEAEEKLIKQIEYHQRIFRLAEKVNDIFTPSVLFSLLSSSFILVFSGYQLLGDISFIIVFKAMFLLGYELKQVVVTCFLGDKLINISFEVSEAIYEQKWYNGTKRYKRLVLIALMRSQQVTALNIAGISDVSLQTLRKVMSISYQVFTVLKSG